MVGLKEIFAGYTNVSSTGIRNLEELFALYENFTISVAAKNLTELLIVIKKEKRHMPDEEMVYGKQSSVVVNHNTKGFTWSIKFYYNEQETTQDEVVEYIEEMDKKLKARFE